MVAAAGLAMAAALPAQPANLRGSEAAQTLTKEFMQEISKVTEAAAAEVTKPSVVAELGYLLGSPTFMLVSLGYAAFTATIGGISTIAPLLLLSLSMFADQGVASTTFGAISALGGVLGTPLGGFVTDLATRRVVAAETL